MDSLITLYRGYLIVNAVHCFEIWSGPEFIESVAGYDDATKTIDTYLNGK